jgi:predicted aspartyl protease
MQELHALGAPLPASIKAKGLIDTGNTVTAVAPRVLTALNAPRGSPTQTQTVSEPVGVHYYQISFTIYNLPASRSVISRNVWLAINLVADLDDIDILFGLDLLRQIILTVDGPARLFALEE